MYLNLLLIAGFFFFISMLLSISVFIFNGKMSWQTIMKISNLTRDIGALGFIFCFLSILSMIFSGVSYLFNWILLERGVLNANNRKNWKIRRKQSVAF